MLALTILNMFPSQSIREFLDRHDQKIQLVAGLICVFFYGFFWYSVIWAKHPLPASVATAISRNEIF